MENKQHVKDPSASGTRVYVVIATVEVLACLAIAVLGAYENIHLIVERQSVPDGIHLLLWAVPLLAILLGMTIAMLFSHLDSAERSSTGEGSSPSVNEQDRLTPVCSG